MKLNWKRIGRRFVYATAFLSALFIIFVITSLIYYTFEKIHTLESKVAALEQKEELSLSGVCDEKESIRNARASVVRIVGDAEGSGFAVGDGQFILTNFHVIEFEPSPKVVLPDGTFETGEVLMADKAADLAFIRIKKQLPPLKFGDSGILEQTDEVYSLGFPFGGDIQGELTVKKGILAGKRHLKDYDIEFLQTDSTINPGLSGGPMTNRCGEVIGVTTLGGSGLGFAIAAASVKEVWGQLEYSDESPLKDIRKLEIKPNESPLYTVQAFYDYIKLRRLDKAYELLGEYKKSFKYENWKKGYDTNLDTTVLSIIEDEEDKNKIYVELSAKDLVMGEIVYRYYEGYWIVKEVDKRFLLWDPEIKEIKNEEL